MRTTIKAALAALAAGTLVLLGAPLSASAHTPSASIDCEAAHVSLTAYDQGATATIILDGTVQHSGPFGGHLVESYPTGGGNTEHNLIVQVASTDGERFNFNFNQTTVGCYTPPPPTEVTGIVTFTDGRCNLGVRTPNSAEVHAVSGVRYWYSLNGSPEQPLPAMIYDESSIVVGGVYTITAQSNDPVHYTYVGQSSWTHTFEAVPAECDPIVIPEQPEDTVTSTSSEVVDCAAMIITTTTVTTTTGTIYDAGINEWIPALPVSETTTSTREATVAECPPPTEPTPIPTEQLATTGADDAGMSVALATAVTLLLAGLAALVIVRLRERRGVK